MLNDEVNILNTISVIIFIMLLLLTNLHLKLLSTQRVNNMIIDKFVQKRTAGGRRQFRDGACLIHKPDSVNFPEHNPSSSSNSFVD